MAVNTTTRTSRLFIHSKSQDLLLSGGDGVQNPDEIGAAPLATDSDDVDGFKGETRISCKRCSLNVLDSDSEEEEPVPDGSQPNEDKECEEDTTDGARGVAKIRKVVRQCTCSVPTKIRKQFGDDALVPTLIMRKYNQYIGVEPKAKTDLKWKDSQKSASLKKITKLFSGCFQAQRSIEDMRECCQATTELCISDPLDGDTDRGSVTLGASAITLKDEESRLRHFISQVQPGSAAHEMELEVEAELLLLDETLLVDISPDQLKQAFSDVNVNEEFTLFTRRVTGTSGGLLANEVEYEYWQVRVILKVDSEGGMIVPEVTAHTQAANGDIIVIGAPSIRRLYIESSKGYLKNVKGSLKIYPQLVGNDDALKFDKLTYSVFIVGGDSTKIVIFRSSSGHKTYFIYVNEGGVVKLRECPSNLQTTPNEELEVGFREGPFSIENTIFFQHGVSQSPNRKFLQSFVRRGHYLHLDRNDYSLKLLDQPDENELNFNDDVKFNLHEV